MENSSPSPTSPASPIVFGPSAFRPGSTILVFIGMLVLVAVVAIAAIAAYLVAHHGDISALTRQSVPFAVSIQAVIDLIVVVYLAIVLPPLAGASLAALGFRTPRAADIGIALIGAVVMVVVVNGLGTIVDALFHARHQQEAIKLFLSVHDPMVKAGFAALAVVVAPIAEEFAFRVFIFNAVRRYGGFWIGAIVSGVFFGLAHTDLYAFVPLIFGGMILCAVYARTRNAWMSMITHGLFNGVSVLALYVAPQLSK